MDNIMYQFIERLKRHVVFVTVFACRPKRVDGVTIGDTGSNTNTNATSPGTFIVLLTSSQPPVNQEAANEPPEVEPPSLNFSPFQLVPYL